MTTRFEDRAQIANTRVLDNGALLVEAACARSGVQTYLGTEIGLSDARPVGVMRPEAVVFDAESLRSYAGKPVTVGHPPEMVSPETWRKAAVGEIQDEVVRDGEKVRVTFRVRDKAAIDAIQGGIREISMGYTSQMQHRDGMAPDGTKFEAVQAGPIEINHLALVSEARGGSELRIGDAAPTWGARPVHPAAKESQMADALQTVVVNDQAFTVNDQGATAIKLLKDALTAAANESTELADKIAEHETTIEAKDAEIATLKKAVEDAKVTPQMLADMAKKRSATMAKAKKMGMAEKDMEDMSEQEMKRRAVQKKMGDEAAKWSDEAVAASFDTLANIAGDTKLADSLGAGIAANDDSTAFSDGILLAAGVTSKKEG